jgi:hypothetical protein
MGDNIKKEYKDMSRFREKVFHGRPDLLACLELLCQLKEKVELQSQEERSDYTTSLLADDSFPIDAINVALDELRACEGKLKQKTIDWIMKYTLNKESAISITHFVVSNILYLRKQISKQEFHKENMGKGKPKFKRSYEQFFSGSKYSCLLEIVWAGHQIITQAKTKSITDKMISTSAVDTKVLGEKRHRNDKSDHISPSTQKKIARAPELRIDQREGICHESQKKVNRGDNHGTPVSTLSCCDQSIPRPKVDPINKIKKNKEKKKETTFEELFKLAEADLAKKLVQKRIDDDSRKNIETTSKNTGYKSIPMRRSLLRTKKGTTSSLPYYVKVPSSVLKNVVTIEDPSNYMYFRVHQVKGDGSCLYHCLSSVHSFAENYSDYAYDTSQVRYLLAESTKKYTTLSKRILDTIVNNANSKKKQVEMKDWQKAIVNENEWGSNAEMLLFSNYFEINVIVLTQTNQGIHVFGTYQYMKECLDYKGKFGCSSSVDDGLDLMEEKFVSSSPVDNGLDFMDSIFIWFHRSGDPGRLIKDEGVEANHFVILQPIQKKFLQDGKDMYVFCDQLQEGDNRILTTTSKKVLSSDLPDYAMIPTQTLQYKVSGLEESMENLYFAAREVPSDGNCLYHAISGSHYFVAKHPGMACDTSRLRKALVECIQSKKNFELAQYLLDIHPPPGVTTIDGWVKRVKENTIWGSVAEVVMFTHLFQINVVMLLQCNNGVSVWGTYNSYKKQLNHQLSELEYEQRIRYDHTVFLWHHRLGDYEKLIKDSKEANHFSILDVCNHEAVDRGRDVFLFRNFWKDTTTSPSAKTCTILDTPPNKK